MLGEDLIRLQQAVGGLRLSLFLPMTSRPWPSARTGRGIQTLLTRAEQELCASDVPSAEVAGLMDRVQHALDQVRPLGERHRGCALFADSSAVQRHNVDFTLPTLAVVGNRFALTPLLPALNARGTFYVLALTQHRIELFVGTAVAVRRLGLDGFELAAWSTMPPLRPAPRATTLVDLSGPAPSGQRGGLRRAAVEREARVQRHYRGVDLALRQILTTATAPLILSGEQDLQALYRTANTYPHLLEPGLGASGGQVDVDDLHRQAWALAAPQLSSDRAAAVGAYHRLRGTDRVIDAPGAAVHAAAEGKVTALLVHETACTWPAGEDPPVVRVGSPTDFSALLEAGVAGTLDGGGDVFVVSPGEICDSAPVLAIRR
ncbi:baeRF3 domain-containing protein [Modestobacter lapidis]|nr:hypothetical protein [Modestobacter lapidis]